MLRFLFHYLWLRVLVYLLAALAVYQAFLLFGGGTDTDNGFHRRTLGEALAREVAVELPKSDRVRSLAVLALAGDTDRLLTGTLREQIERSGKYDVMDEGFFTRVIRELGRDETAIGSLTDALAVGRRLGVDYVLFGEVADFETTEARTSLKVNLRLADRATGEAVFARTFEQASEGGWTSPDYWRARTADSSRAWRVFIWVMFAVLLPILLAPVIRRVTAEESNAANLALLVGLTGVDMLVAGALTGFWVPSWLTAVALLLAFVLSAGYNYAVTTKIDELAR